MGMMMLNLHTLVVAAVVWASLISAVLAFTAADYSNALGKSILFYDLQRSGRLPRWQRLRWRGNSAMNDGRSQGVDLSGGYYDAGDNLKFGLPMAFSMTILSWSVVEYYGELRRTGQLGNTLNAIRWGTDYFMKAHTAPNELWVQVGNPYSDHSCWQRPEDMTTDRTAYKIDASRPGSDVAGETSAALAAASIAFRGVDRAYSARLLRSAQQLFTFADRYRGKYSDSLSGVVCPFYCSYSGFNDELVWAAAWLYKATGSNWYNRYLINNGAYLGGTTTSVNMFSWDNKFPGAQVLLAQNVLRGNRGLQGYKDRADQFVCSIMMYTARTPGGLLFLNYASNTQYVTTATFLLTTYAKYLSGSRRTVNCGGRQIRAGEMYSFARQQVDYIMGRNPTGLSYLVGFGRNPTHIHHRASSLPSIRAHSWAIGCSQGFSYYWSGNPNPNQATGAILGGPDQSDHITDSRSNYAQTEPTTYITAPMVGVLAALAAGRVYY